MNFNVGDTVKVKEIYKSHTQHDKPQWNHPGALGTINNIYIGPYLTYIDVSFNDDRGTESYYPFELEPVEDVQP